MLFSITDVQWLASHDGCRMLDETAAMLQAGEGEIRVIQKLRKLNIPPNRSGLLVEQSQLRSKALVKFARAQSMLFEDRLLQQSTDERLARYKARRFQGAANVVDICCGLGGDAMGIGSVSDVTAIDSNEVACFLTRHNAGVNAMGEFSFTVEQCDANAIRAEPGAWFHIDPDRRSSKSRLTRVEDFSPGIEVLQPLVERQRHGAIKIAPASDLPDIWQGKCERQWIGDRHECKQQLLWFGDAARSGVHKSAAAIDDHGDVVFEWSPSNGSNSIAAKRTVIAPAIGQFLYEPHATILAGDMTNSLARELELARIDHDVEYLTGNERLEHGALSTFEVIEVVRLDRRDIQSALESNDCGMLEVKKRGVDHALMKPWQQSKFDGGTPLVLFLTRCSGKHVAVIATRIT